LAAGIEIHFAGIAAVVRLQAADPARFQTNDRSNDKTNRKAK
jgi:hypothetical protein